MDASKAARNQALFREVNERVRGLDYSNSHTEFVCECADPDCTETVGMDLDEYEEIRRVPTHFLVAAGMGHVFPNVERISERHPGYWVVEKSGEAGLKAVRLVADRRVTQGEVA